MTKAQRAGNERHTIVLVVAWLLSCAAGFAILVALGAIYGLCQEHQSGCLDGEPNLELVLQVPIAVLGFAAALMMWFLAKRRSYRAASGALLVAVLLFATWAVLLDAGTHGWDNLKLLWLGVGS
jgi:hypothetical protein